MLTLDALAEKHGTDKGSVAVHGLYPKGYTRLYERYFASLREEPITLLEIGVQAGASVRMWEEYFPLARIVGIDINPECQRFATDRTTIMIGDQTDREFLREVTTASAPLTLVIDDGGHRMSQHQVSLEELWPALTSGGMYVIEDLHTAYIPRFGGGYRSERSTIEYLKDHVDVINHRAEGDERLPGLDEIHFSKSLAVLVRR